MTEIRMYSETRTDYDCEATGLPAERWAEAVFKIGMVNSNGRPQENPMNRDTSILGL